MPNVHMQTAARDLQRAVADLRQKEQEVRAAADQNKRDMEDKLTSLRLEQNRLRIQGANSDEASIKVAAGARFTGIRAEISRLEKDLFRLEDDTRRQLQDLENQAVQIDGLSRQLQMMA
jgi:ABC-type phosphate transport system auxiliary subunit